MLNIELVAEFIGYYERKMAEWRARHIRYVNDVRTDLSDDVVDGFGTGLIVPVFEADRFIGSHRKDLDRSGQWGVPAHVTVVSPFLPLSAVTEAVVSAVRSAVRPIGAFTCRFEFLRWFGRDVLWLAPIPAEPFRQLTTAIQRAIPAYQSYRFTDADVVPHLTIGERSTGGYAALRAAERDIQSCLPIVALIERVILVAGDSATGQWGIVHEFPLGQSSAQH